MKYTDKDMTCHLKAVVITIIFLLALSGTDSNSRKNSILECKLTSAVHQTDVRAVLAPETTCFAVLLPFDIPDSNRTVIEKNKIAFDSRLFEQRLKTIGKSHKVIIPFPQLHINFQLIPLKQDDPPSLS
jgi:hypothetical protein